MKIYFCDGCNESVPLADVQSGQVTAIKGKLFCPNCIPPSAVLAPSRPTAAPARSGTNGLLLVLVVLLVGWTVWRDRALFLEVAPAIEEDPESSPLALVERRVEGLESGLNQLRADSGQRGRHLASLQGDLEDLRAVDSDQALTMARLEDELDRLATAQAGTGQLIEKVQLTANRVTSQESRMEALSDAVAAHQVLLDMGTLPAAATADGTQEPATRDPAVDPARVAAIEEIRRMLVSPEPDARFEGVDRVEEGRYQELAGDLVGLLGDEDMFVRLHTMNVLGNFAYEDAVPALFGVLDDSSAAIRKKAAETLVRLTGYDPGYDHKASPAERAKVVKKWTDWYAAR